MTGNKLVYLQRLDSQLLHNPEIEVAVFCLFFFPAQSCRKEKKKKDRKGEQNKERKERKEREKESEKEREKDRKNLYSFFF